MLTCFKIFKFLKYIPSQVDAYKTASFATKISFFNTGFSTAPWAVLMPYVRTRLNIDDITLASLMLTFGIGATISMQLTGYLARLLGVKRLIFIATVGMYLSMTLTSLSAITLNLAFIYVFLWGVFLGCAEISNNIHATHIEQQVRKLLLPGFHAWYNIGCIISVIIYPILLSFRFSTGFVSTLVAITGLLLLAYITKDIINTHGQKDEVDTSKAEDLKDTKLSYKVLTLQGILLAGIICFIMDLCEGMIYDWGGVYLMEKCSCAIALSSVGYLCFQVSVAIMRVFGSSLVAKLGNFKTLSIGAFVSFLCLVTAAVSDNFYVIVISFALLGFSSANALPIIISIVARRSGGNKARAISIVGTLGYSGILAGPALLGGVASVFNLSAIFYTVAVLVVLMMFIIPHVAGKKEC